jgi:hypothetical protein
VYYGSGGSVITPGTLAPVDRIGDMTYAGDFDGDGFGDLISTPTANGQSEINVHLGGVSGANDVDLFILRKGEIRGDILHDFNPQTSGGRDRILFEGFSDGSDYTVTQNGRAITIREIGGAYVETFHIAHAPPGLGPGDWDFIT